MGMKGALMPATTTITTTTVPTPLVLSETDRSRVQTVIQQDHASAQTRPRSSCPSSCACTARKRPELRITYATWRCDTQGG